MKNDIKSAIFILSAVASLAIGIIFGTELNKAQMTNTVIAEVIHTRYTMYGRYYTDGTLITEDGNEWGYDTNTVSDKPVYDNMPVWVGFDNNGTPEDVTDDVILGMVYDRTTAIMDELEHELSTMDGTTVIRNGNNIKLEVNN